MTWYADQTEGRVGGEARERLLAQRQTIVDEIEKLKAAPLRSKTNAAVLGRQEDLIALAKKVTSIDKKLGRLVD